MGRQAEALGKSQTESVEQHRSDLIRTNAAADAKLAMGFIGHQVWNISWPNWAMKYPRSKQKRE
jgi:hypothetical protein